MSWTWNDVLQHLRRVLFARLKGTLRAAALAAVAGTSGCIAQPAEYTVEPLITDSPIHGVNGMEFDQDGYLIVSSMAGAEI